MARLLLIVERVWPLEDFTRRVFHLEDHAHLVIVPGIEVETGERFGPGDGLHLRRPDGSTLEARIGAILQFGFNRTRQGEWAQYDSAIAVRELVPDDVPVGTEIWSVDRPPQRPG